MRPHRLDGLVALVTGAGRGIGRAIASRLLEEGARVVVMDVDEAAVRDAADELGAGEHAGKVSGQVGNVADEAGVERVIAAAVAWGGSLDILVNNAANADPTVPPLEEMSLADWQQVIDINLTGTFLMARHAAAHLRARKGAIVNLTSTRAFMSEPHNEAYAATKGGIVALTHALANTLGPDVRVNAIAPGWIATSAWNVRSERKPPELRDVDHAQHPVGRVGRPEDVAALAAYLVSNEAGFVTGQTFVIDGGMTKKMIYAE
jgi:NAD(P)-dependent dehydrogenase (short-subunit alcohol dehydrogenase family)